MNLKQKAVVFKMIKRYEIMPNKNYKSKQHYSENSLKDWVNEMCDQAIQLLLWLP